MWFGFISILLTTSSWAKPHTLSIGLPVKITAKDPMDLELVEEWEAAAAVYDTLIKLRAGENIKPSLAESWKIDESQSTITFKLKPQLVFSNGEPLNAESISYSFKRILVVDGQNPVGVRAQPQVQGSQIISRCLAEKKRIKNPHEPHPSIEVLDDRQIRVRLAPGCIDNFLKEIANASYGIVSPSSVGPDFKVVKRQPVSGPFAWAEGEDHQGLIRNPKHWRWAGKNLDRGVDRIELPLVRPEDGGAAAALSNPDLLRISSPDSLAEFRRAGYEVLYSGAIMTWFLSAPGSIDSGFEPYDRVIDDLSRRLNRSSLPYFKDNPLEWSAEHFFPPEFKCGVQPPTRLQAPTSVTPTHPPIVLVDHSSGESKRFSVQLAQAMRALGYPVELLSPALARARRDKKEVWFRIRRQFLGDDLLPILDSIYHQFKAIPDPKSRMTAWLDRIEKLPPSARSAELAQFCSEFDHSHHVPIAHRRYGFLYRKKEYASIFSSVSGNISFEDITQLE